ncbi:MAG: TrbG/VirB9 family P-type conjugative transfer protein, partial [Caldimonas sp.]
QPPGGQAMNRTNLLCLAVLANCAHGAPADPQLREVTYDAGTVVTVPVKRGVVTLIVLDPDEAIVEVASGSGADCTKPDSAWCVSAQPGGRTIFVKPKGNAGTSNNLAVVTDRRSHSFRLAVLADADAKAPLYRLVVNAPVVPVRVAPTRAVEAAQPLIPLIIETPPEEIVAERLLAAPRVVNSSYSIAEGKTSEDIIPSLVFDDGRFTYLRFGGNREVPAVFQVLGDGSETVTNSRMEGDLLVVDRVGRRLMLRAGTAVVGVWNDAFDLNGLPPLAGTAVPGIERAIKSTATSIGGSR